MLFIHFVCADPTPENAASERLVSSAKLRSTETMSTVGKRLVSEKEWQMLQQEVSQQLNIANSS